MDRRFHRIGEARDAGRVAHVPVFHLGAAYHVRKQLHAQSEAQAGSLIGAISRHIGNKLPRARR